MSVSPPKSVLIVIRSAPYGSQTAKETLDIILTAAAFEQPLSLLFCDDGVFQLLPEQQSSLIHAKSLGATLPVLPMYDVNQIYADRSALQRRGMEDAELLLPVSTLNADEMAELAANHDAIISF